ncbi:MAG: LysR family transcriptional regulator [Pseudomonadales bacterium]|jgi:LysR family transcriptional regulator for metE and metH|nr:LysR family transcriptional regulator [Pseudomonadales bacterium]MDP6470946.1 LysR family transcriptional regulator [Pseudomonadales bacterium]MDP6825869.1 LysR family transcriptional regulator [Pseudomonadales bacterium]MDP6972837.1 LysR family transcriptional regulator [Pseudomonadales bacterium]|tara:strand:+ start:766 stop:1692 length:927 start_codon:yes stop_codon:yes gene_type:complete
MSHIELRHLRTLVALRDTGSLVEAAERVFLTQSALSHQIKDLETRVGCALFIRKTRPARFTSAGRRLLKLADEVLPLVHGCEQDIDRLAGGESGRIYMAIECHSCFEWLLPAINLYRESWPDVELDVASGFHFAPLPALARGDLDLVVTADPVEDLGLEYLSLFSYEAQLAVPKDHALALKEWVEPCDLQEEVLITYPVDRARLDVFTSFLDPAGVEPKRVRQAELTTMMIQLVASGRGVVCLPNWALHEYLQRDFVAVTSLGEEGVWPTLYAAVRSDQAQAAFIQGFLQTAKESCFANLVGIVTADL